MARSLPRSLAPVVERLELDQPEIVTSADLARMALEFGIGTAPALVAHRLLRLGWLLPTGVNGAWEFVPGSHAGPHSRGGPLLPIKAALARKPDLPAAVALSSAAWLWGLADHAPPTIELAVRPGTHLPAGLRRQVQVLWFDARLPAGHRRGVPVQRLASVLVHLAARPARIASWGGVVEWLADAVSEVEEAELRLELIDRPHAVHARLAYLLQGLWPAAAERIGAAGGGAGKGSRVWFGRRAKVRRHAARWHVADTLLPFDPAQLAPVRGD